MCLCKNKGYLTCQKKNELMHHGIKGQKWGVRRYQNKDGTLTAEGKARGLYRRNAMRNARYTDDVNEIVSTLSNREKDLLGAERDSDWIDKDYLYETASNKANTFLTKHGDTPISFVEIWSNGSRTGQIALATRSGEEYRHKGYANADVERAIKWAYQYGKKSLDELEWIAEESNTGSRHLAEKHGFVETPPVTDKPELWEGYVRYTKQLK